MSTKESPHVFMIKIYCAQCNAFLYKYKKVKKGSVLRCYVDRIVEDSTKGDMKCPDCGQEFARFRIIKNKPAHKLIQGKTFIKGHLKK